MGWGEWPAPMSLEENFADMEMHAREFENREAFTYSVLDGESVIGCVYIYPHAGHHVADVRSWVRESRSEMDQVIWEAISEWLANEWPFESVVYASRG